MSRKIYLVRHCEASGQSANAHLTENGYKQAIELSEFFRTEKIDRIISSPYTRAIESAKPLSQRTGIEIEMDENLVERVLSKESIPDWQEKLKASFSNLDFKLEGGESSSEAMERIVSVIGGIFETEGHTIVISHGNLMTLLLMNYNKKFDFDSWQNLSNPDVYLLQFENDRVLINRVWNGGN